MRDEMTEASGNRQDGLHPHSPARDGPSAPIADLELGLAIYKRHSTSPTVMRGMRSRTTEFIERLPLLSQIQRRWFHHLLPHTSFNLQYLWPRWNVRRKGGAAISETAIQSLPINLEATQKDLPEVERVREARPSELPEFTGKVFRTNSQSPGSTHRTDYSHHKNNEDALEWSPVSLDIASSIHARYGSSPGLVSA